MDLRSFARIEWVGARLGLRMVNASQKAFFLNAEALLMLYRKPFALVKYADSFPERCVRHHGGEIWASLSISESGYSRVSLYLIAVERRIRVSPDVQMRDVVAVQEYNFPTEELDSFRRSIEAMVMQRVEFETLRMDADTSPL